MWWPSAVFFSISSFQCSVFSVQCSVFSVHTTTFSALLARRPRRGRFHGRHRTATLRRFAERATAGFCDGAFCCCDDWFVVPPPERSIRSTLNRCTLMSWMKRSRNAGRLSRIRFLRVVVSASTWWSTSPLETLISIRSDPEVRRAEPQPHAAAAVARVLETPAPCAARNGRARPQRDWFQRNLS